MQSDTITLAPATPGTAWSLPVWRFGTPGQGPKAYIQAALHADEVPAMLVAQGLTDPRVPPHESEQIVAALRARDVPVDYLTFPDEGHGFLKRDSRRAATRGVLAFLARHLLRASPPTGR